MTLALYACVCVCMCVCLRAGMRAHVCHVCVCVLSVCVRESGYITQHIHSMY